MVAGNGHGDVEFFEDGIAVEGGQFLVDSHSRELFASSFFDFGNAFGGVSGKRKHGNARHGFDSAKDGLSVGTEVFRTENVNFVETDNKRFTDKERFDGFEQGNLSVDRVTALFRDVDEEDDGSLEMSKGSDGKHFDGVTFFKRVVDDTRSVENLVTLKRVVAVTDEEGFGGEGVGLDFGVSTRDLVDKGGLADVGVTTEEKSFDVGVNGRQAGKMLADLFEVLE